MAKKKKILKFITSGSCFDEALFCGNGHTGVVIKGGAKRDDMRLNDFRLFYDNYDGEQIKTSQDENDLKKGRRNYGQIKSLLAKKEYEKAEFYLCKKIEKTEFVAQKLLTRGLCDVIFDFFDLGLVEDYYRQVDMDTGEVEVGFTCGEGGIIRKCFVDRNSDLVCFRIDGLCEKLIDMEFSLQDLTSPNNCSCISCQDSCDTNGNCGEKTSVLSKKSNQKKDKIKQNTHNDCCEELNDCSCDSCQNKASIKIEGDKIIFINQTNGEKFGCVGKIFTNGGEISATKDSFVVSSASRVYIYLKTFFDNQIDNAKTLVDRANYEQLFEISSKIFNEKMNVTTVEFFDEEDNCIEESFVNIKNNDISGDIVEKLYYYGKYLYLSCFEGKFSSGLFCLDKQDLAINNHLEFARLVGFLSECGLDSDIKVLGQNFFEKMETYKKIARDLFGCKGIFVPAKQDYFYGNFSENSPCNLLDKNIGAELSLIFYNYYKKSDDLEFLKGGGYEFIEGVGDFYLDFFERSKVTNAFDSPFGVSDNSKCENTGRSIASNCLSDFACAKVVFYLLTQLCIVANKQESLSKWEEALSKIPDIEVDNHGVVKEYNSRAYLSSNLSPYISYLFPYNIGSKPFATKKDFETLIVNSIKYKYISALGFFGSGELIDMALALFTCGEGKDGFEIMFSIIKNFLNSNLIFNEYDKYSMGFGDGIKTNGMVKIDKNTCLCKCIQNMFMVSSKNNVFLFDSLPEFSKRGKITNLRLSKHLVASMEYIATKKIAKIRLRSDENIFINIFLPRTLKKIKGRHLPEVDSIENVLRGVEMPKGKLRKIKIYY